MLLFSSITYGFAMLDDERGQARRDAGVAGGHRRCSASASWASSSTNSRNLIHEGATPQRSAFLSSFFTLVGTHGLHVTFGVDLAGRAAGAGQASGADPRQPAAADVPQPVLALPRRDLDRRLHLRLSAGSAAMSADDHDRTRMTHAHGHGTRRELSDRLRAVGRPDRDPVLAGDDAARSPTAGDRAGHHGVRRRCRSSSTCLLPAHEHAGGRRLDADGADASRS